MKANQRTQRHAPGRKPASRATIGMFTNWLGGLHQEQWLGAVDAARAQQANLISFPGRALSHPDNFYAQANVIYDLVSPEQIDGLVIWTTTLQAFVGQQQIEAFCQHYHSLPIVSVEQVMAGVPSLLIDNKQGMRAAVSHLIAVHGYRRIAFIRGPANHEGAQERYQGYVEALAQHGLPLDQTLVSPYPRHWLSEEAAAMVHRLLDAHPPSPPLQRGGEGGIEAIVATNDNLALGVLSALQARHIRVPGDMAVVGFDNQMNLDPDIVSDDPAGAQGERTITFSATTLPLTTVQPPFYALGWRAVELLLAQLRGEDVPEVVRLPTELIVRRSCGCFSQAVRQIAPEPIVRMPHPRPLGQASAIQQVAIIAQMQQARQPAPAGLAPAWAERLLTAFISAVQGETTNTFLAALDEFVRTSVRSGDRPERWWPVLFALRQQTLPYLVSGAALARAEAVWQRVQALMGELAERFSTYQQVLAEKRDEIVREVGQKLITTLDTGQLATVLAQALPTLGIPSCYLALYVSPPQRADGPPVWPGEATAGYPSEWAWAILGYEQGQQLELTAGEAVFRSKQLAPGARLRAAQPDSMVIEPLYFKKQQLGFVLFAVGPRVGWIYGVLREQLSSALQGALLVEREKRALVEVEQARARAEAANAAKSVFLANMSHELRTPLNGVLGYAQILERQVGTDSPLLDGLRTIEQSGEHLLALINDILDLARVEAGKLELSPTDLQLPSFLRAVVNIVRIRAEAKDLVFTYATDPDLPAVILADALRLRQVLLNLLGNAIKFTDHGHITLRVSAELRVKSSELKELETQNSCTLRFAVADTGVGIPPDQIERLFQPFEQGGELAQRAGGVGLGLGISRQLVRLMGGDIQVESVVGQGSTFAFALTVPLVEAQTPTPTTSRRVIGYRGPRRTLLIVDDIPSNRAVMVDLLQPLGFAIVEAADGRRAIDLAQATRPDLILMDRRMPELSGLEAALQIRQIPELHSVPIIEVSASVSDADQALSREMGYNAFLPKPISWPKLAALLADQLQLEWEYAGTGAGDRQEDAAILLAPPQDELAILFDLAMKGNFTDLEQRAADLEQRDQRLRPFAQKLRQLAQVFEEDEIVAFVAHHMEQAR